MLTYSEALVVAPDELAAQPFLDFNQSKDDAPEANLLVEWLELGTGRWSPAF